MNGRMAFSPANLAHLQRTAGNTRVTSFVRPDQGPSTPGPEQAQPVQRQAGATAAPVPPRVINLSGGGTITVYGSFPAAVEVALADGWLSFLEMGDLSMGVGKVSDDAGHDMMMMLTQRDLALRGDKTIPNLSETETLTWQGPDGKSGVKALRTLSRQAGSGHLVNPVHRPQRCSFFHEEDSHRARHGFDAGSVQSGGSVECDQRRADARSR